MSSVVLSGDSSGSITLAAPSVAGTNTITLPAATGTAMVSGNMPAFSAYKSSGVGNQSITSATFTKITFDTEEFDTNNNFASSRFTPTVAGYYQISASLDCQATGLTSTQTSIYKNGANFKAMGYGGITATEPFFCISSLVYLNGSTDYVEIYAYINGTSPVVNASAGQYTWFQAVLVRAA
jgi:hypothetical protein